MNPESVRYGEVVPMGSDPSYLDFDLSRFIRFQNQLGKKVVTFESFSLLSANNLITVDKEILPYVSDNVFYVIRAITMHGIGVVATALPQVQFYDRGNVLGFWTPWQILANSNTPFYLSWQASMGVYRLRWLANGATGGVSIGLYNYIISGFKITLNG